MITNDKPLKHCEHECVCTVLAIDRNDDGKSPCKLTICKHDTRNFPHTSISEQEIRADERDGVLDELKSWLVSDREFCHRIGAIPAMLSHACVIDLIETRRTPRPDQRSLRRLRAGAPRGMGPQEGETMRGFVMATDHEIWDDYYIRNKFILQIVHERQAGIARVRRIIRGNQPPAGQQGGRG